MNLPCKEAHEVCFANWRCRKWAPKPNDEPEHSAVCKEMTAAIEYARADAVVVAYTQLISDDLPDDQGEPEDVAMLARVLEALGISDATWAIKLAEHQERRR